MAGPHGTTLIEAVHLGRDALGVEYEPRWAALAAQGIDLAKRQGAAGDGEVVRGDARQLESELADATTVSDRLLSAAPRIRG